MAHLACDDKALGAYFTPEAVVDALVRWAVRDPADLLLDPSCGDGRFVARPANSVGVERNPSSVAEASGRAPQAEIVEDDFFVWAASDRRRFDCVVGNPPFIRYQRFAGATRRAALDRCRRLGAAFSGLSSSWAPFIVAAAGKLRPGGRLAFVAPAEIGHAPYARPLVDYLTTRFGSVHVVREKLFPRLSEDCWLLFAGAAGRRTGRIRLPSIRNSRYVTGAAIGRQDVERWIARDEPVLLLRIPPRVRLPAAIRAYLDTAEGRRARASYKCRNREPWYAVPDVRRPAFVLNYMSGGSPGLAVNRGGCTCTNALLAVDPRPALFENGGASPERLLVASWGSSAGRLSCEIEGHPLGGGMLKLEPGEARQVMLIPPEALSRRDDALLDEGVEVMRQWRHVA